MITAMSAQLAAMRSSLGEPYYENDSVLLYQGDCRDYLHRLAPMHQVPLTITSPPYNIGKEYENPLPLDQYLDWCAAWLEDVWTVTTSSGALWLNLGYVSLPARAKAIPLPYLLWERLPFFLVQEVVWHYEAGVASRKSLSPRNEKWLWCVKDEHDYTFDLDSIRDPNVKYPNQKKNGKLKVNPNGKNPGDVWLIPKVTSGQGRSSSERAPHPAQFPMALVERIAMACSTRGEVILDPFSGSGTVADVAMRTGRKSIGFELRADYLDFAAQRLEKTQGELASRLFDGVDSE